MTEAVARAGRPENASSELDAGWDVSHAKHPEDGEELPELKRMLEAEARAWTHLQHQAAVRAIRIGVLLLKARADLPRGEWVPWVRANAPWKRVQVWRFTRLAEGFLRQKGCSLADAFAQIGPKRTEQAERSEQMLFEFIGDRSLEQVYADLGIRYHAKGGDLGGGKQRAERLKGLNQAELEVSVAAEQLLRLVQEAREFCARKRWRVLPEQDVAEAVRALKECVQAIQEG